MIFLFFLLFIHLRQNVLYKNKSWFLEFFMRGRAEPQSILKLENKMKSPVYIIIFEILSKPAISNNIFEITSNFNLFKQPWEI